ncbi:ROK family protein [Streptomyces sp. NBC_01335]|uniref:ROK family protein n=1 Tax=Streptomyces sp. NBC_01335 TaxID=2903828 RepID=UPI002E0DBBCC|nr:ROK family protein [Streptomyces sp. NBC_01335]
MLESMHSHRGPLAQLRRGHEERVLGLLRRHGQLSRAELGRLSGLSRTTLYDIVATLVAGGAVVPGAADPGPRKRGRPVEHLTLDPAAGQALGIDFARRSVHVAAANVAHEMIGSASLPHPPDLPWEGRVDLAEKLVASLADGALRLSALGATGAVGVGVVGPVRRTETEDARAAEGHRITRPGGGHGGTLTDLVELLTTRFGAPVLIDNNTRLAALAEATWGAAAGSRDVLYLRLSHGVGGGLVVNGALHRGVDGLAGELGHITADPSGGPCECGGTGCLETVASIGAVLTAYREQGGTARDFTAFLASLEGGDKAAEEVLRRAGTLVGAVLASVVGALGPSTIVLGGELAEAGDALLGPVAEALDAHVLPLARGRVTLRPAALGEAGGAHGGVALALHESPLLARYPGPALPEDDDA